MGKKTSACSVKAYAMQQANVQIPILVDASPSPFSQRAKVAAGIVTVGLLLTTQLADSGVTKWCTAPIHETNACKDCRSDCAARKAAGKCATLWTRKRCQKTCSCPGN